MSSALGLGEITTLKVVWFTSAVEVTLVDATTSQYVTLSVVNPDRIQPSTRLVRLLQ